MEVVENTRRQLLDSAKSADLIEVKRVRCWKVSSGEFALRRREDPGTFANGEPEVPGWCDVEVATATAEFTI